MKLFLFILQLHSDYHLVNNMSLMKEMHFQYSLFNEIYDLCRNRLGMYSLDYNITKYMLCEMELPVTSLVSIGVHNNGRVLKLLLEKKLECDEHFKEVVTFIRGEGIAELDLMELDKILNEFPYGMFFGLYFYKCLAGCDDPYTPTIMCQKHSIDNVLKYYKNVNNFIEDALECGIYDGNFSFLQNLYENMRYFEIQFTFSTTKKHDNLIEWLQDAIDNFDREDSLLEEKMCYSKTLDIVRLF